METGPPAGRRGAGPGLFPLLLFLDSGILSSVSFQTFRDHTAVFKTPRGDQRVPGLSSRQDQASSWDPRAGSAEFGLLEAGTCGGLMLWVTLAFLMPKKSLKCSLPRIPKDSVSYSDRVSTGGGGVYPKYMNIHDWGLRYWMILDKLLNCFSAQLVA